MCGKGGAVTSFMREVIIYFPFEHNFITISWATKSGQDKASHGPRIGKPTFLYGDALRAKRGRKKSQTANRDRDKHNHKECK